jgi:hypothetical protein
MKSVGLLKPHATSIAYLKPTHVGLRIMHTNDGQNRHVDYCFSRLLTLPCYIVAVHYTVDEKLSTKSCIKIWREEHFEDLGVNENIILKWFVREFEDRWRAFVDTILNTAFRFNKMQVICWNRKLMKTRTWPNLTFCHPLSMALLTTRYSLKRYVNSCSTMFSIFIPEKLQGIHNWYL